MTQPNNDVTPDIDIGEDALSYDYPCHESHSDVMKVKEHYKKAKLLT